MGRNIKGVRKKGIKAKGDAWENMFCEREGGGGEYIFPLLLRCQKLYLSLVELVYNYIQPLGISPVESSTKYTDMGTEYK